MGLGKTIQVISLFCHLMEHRNVYGPFLVIAPASTLFNWKNEIKKFGPSIKVMPFWGSLKERKIIRKYLTNGRLGKPDSQFNVIITSYQLALADEKILGRINWNYIVLDEA